MKTVAECRQCAEECRSLLSETLSEEHRAIVLVMIEIWDALARERDRRQVIEAGTAHDHPEHGR